MAVVVESAGRWSIETPVDFGLGVIIAFVGLGFLVVGQIFVFSSLPHTEVLECLRPGPGPVTCEAWQESTFIPFRLAERRLELAEGGAKVVSIETFSDEGTNVHRVSLLTASGKGMPWGKSHAAPEPAEAKRAEIAAFLDDASRSTARFEERATYWITLPVGILALLAGILMLFGGFLSQAWAFDPEAGKVVRRRRLFGRFTVHTTERALRDAKLGVAVSGVPPEPEAPSPELRLVFGPTEAWTLHTTDVAEAKAIVERLRSVVATDQASHLPPVP